MLRIWYDAIASSVTSNDDDALSTRDGENEFSFRCSRLPEAHEVRMNRNEKGASLAAAMVTTVKLH